MRTLGLIGGMSWESTVPYYRIINECVKQRLGGLHSAKLVLVSVDFAEIEQLQRAGDWHRAGQVLGDYAATLRTAGAEAVVLCTNTMHMVADAIGAGGGLPLLHIADATAQEIRRHGVRWVGLLGTRFTMEQPFYRNRLEGYGIDVLVPDDDDRQRVHDVIFQELCLGKVEPASRAAYRAVMERLVARGAQAIVLGCTEIALLVDAGDARVPLFDTTRIHAEAAAAWALDDAVPL